MIIKLHKKEYKNNILVDDYINEITKTKHGLKVTKMESVSPDKTVKHVYNFSFE